MGLARGGSMASNGSGEQMVAFSTANRLPRAPRDVAEIRALLDGPDRPPWLLSALFQATIEATEEAVANALFSATTVIGHDGNTLFAMPHEPALAALDASGRLSR
jgi:D-aminopeptidase